MSLSKIALLHAALGATLFGALSAVAADDPNASQTKSVDTAPARTVPTPLNGGTPGEFVSDPSKVTLERLPNGTRLYHMNGQGMESVVAHINKDGKLEYTCTDAGESAMQSSATAQTREEQAREE
jgi:hypothetical protein